jgi:nitrite reductase (NADH) small subunit
MPQWIKIGSKASLPGPGEAAEFDAAGKMICVANVNGACSAMDNACLHHGAPLGQGVVMDGKVICPWHGWAYDAVSGESDRGNVKVAVYPLKIEGDDVLIEM